MATQNTSMYLSIVRKIVSFPIAKQFAVLLVFLTCTLFSFPSNPAFAQAGSESSVTLPNLEESRVVLSPEEQAWLSAHPNIVLGYADSQEPQLIVNPDGSYSGIVVDLLDELNRRLGTAIRLEAYPVKKLIEKAKKREIDGILNLHPGYAERLEMLKTNGYFQMFPAIFARRDLVINSPDDIAGKTVALVDKVYFSEKLIRQYGDQATIKRVTSVLEGLESLENGEADIFIGVSHNSYLISKYQLYDIAVKYIYTDFSDKTVIAIRPDWPILAEILNKGLATFSDTDLNLIVARWVQLPGLQQRFALTAEERGWLGRKHIVRVRVVDRPPYIYLDKGKPVGLAVDLLDEVSRHTGIGFRYVVPSPSFKEDLDGLIQQTGPDLIVTITPTRERESTILFTKPYSSSKKFIFTRNDVPFVASLEALNDKTVAVIEGFIVHDILARDYPNIDLLLFKNGKDALNAVSSGTAYAFIDSLVTTPAMINRFGFANLRANAPASSIPVSSANMGVRNDWPELRDLLNKVFDTIPPEKMSSLVNKWSTIKFDHGIRTSDILKWVLAVTGVAAVIILLFVGWNRQLARRVQWRTAELQDTVQSLATQVKEREAAEKALAAKEAEELAMINAVNNPFFLMETDGTIVVANQGMAKMYGKEASDLIGTNTYDYLPEDIAENRKKHVEQAVSSGEVYVFEDDRSGRIMEHRLYPIKEESGVVHKLAVFATDITNEVVTQQLLKTSEEQFRSLVEQSPLSIQIFDPDGTISMVNQAWMDLWEIPDDSLPEVLEKYNILEDGEARKRGLMPFIEQVFEGHNVVMPVIEYDASITMAELEVAGVKGRKRYIQLRMYPVKDIRGTVVSVVGIEEDLTEQKRAEDALRQSHDYLKHVTGTVPDAIFSVKMPQRIIEWADDSFQVLGYDPEEYIDRSAEIFYRNPDDFRQVGRLLAEAISAGEQMVHAEVELRRKNGEVFPAELSSTLFRENGEVTSLTALVRDITERKQAEEKIAQYQDRLKALASQLTIAEEKERRRLAAELHDHVGQSLVFSRIQLSGIMEQTSDESLKESIDEVSQSLMEIIKDTRELVFDLSSPLLNEVGLSAATSQWLSKDIGEKYGLETEFIDNSENVIHDNEMKSLLFRNIRELLTNVVKHAYAKKVRVCFANHEDNLIITVEDNGIGFSVKRGDDMAPPSDGFGLFSIQERLDDVGGALEIGSPPDKGCRVTMTVPLTS